MANCGFCGKKLKNPKKSHCNKQCADRSMSKPRAVNEYSYNLHFPCGHSKSMGLGAHKAACEWARDNL